MDAILRMYICYSTNKLCKDSLCLAIRNPTVFDKIIVKLIAAAIFQCKPYERFGDNNFVESDYMWMYKLSVMVNLSSKVGIIFVG